MEPDEQETLKQLARRLKHREAPVRQAAVQEARSLPPDAILWLIRKMECQRKTRLFVMCVALVGQLSLSFILGKVFPLIMGAFTWPFLLLIAIYGRLEENAKKGLAELLGTVENIRSLPILLELANDRGNGGTGIRIALKRVLPQLRADFLLNARQKQILHRFLREPYDDVELTLAILKALEQVGDKTAIPVVAELAQGPRITARMQQIRFAAEACLPFLNANNERQNAIQTLLRPSDAATLTPPDVLLRPAEPTADHTPANELLRAVGTEAGVTEPETLALTHP